MGRHRHRRGGRGAGGARARRGHARTTASRWRSRRGGVALPVPSSSRWEADGRVRPLATVLLSPSRKPAARRARGRRRDLGARADRGGADAVPSAGPARADAGRARRGVRRRSRAPAGAHPAHRRDRRRADRRDQRARLPRRPDRVRAARRSRPVRPGRPHGRGGRVWGGDRAEGHAADPRHDAREPRRGPRRAAARVAPAVVSLRAHRLACHAHDPAARGRRRAPGRGPAHPSRGRSHRPPRARRPARGRRRRLARSRDGRRRDARAARLRRWPIGDRELFNRSPSRAHLPRVCRACRPVRSASRPHAARGRVTISRSPARPSRSSRSAFCGRLGGAASFDAYPLVHMPVTRRNRSRSAPR